MSQFEKITLLQKQLEETQKALNEAFEEAKILLQVDRAELKKEQAGWEALANKLDRSLLPNRIRLDVGGTIFATSKSTLLAQKNSFFEGMFGGRFDTKPEDDGTYFIDRNPCVFGIILDYMRGQKMKLEKLSEDDFETLKEDAEFYQLQGLIALLEELKPKFEFLPGPEGLYTLSENNTRATKIGNDGHFPNVKGVELPRKGIVRWKIAIIRIAKNNNLMIGIAPTTIEPGASGQYSSCGYYIYTSNSTLYSGPPFSYSGHSTCQYGFKGQIAQGQVVGVQVNMDARTVEFFLDGQSLGIAYNGIPTGVPLCPCVIMYGQNDVIEIRPWD